MHVHCAMVSKRSRSGVTQTIKLQADGRYLAATFRGECKNFHTTTTHGGIVKEPIASSSMHSVMACVRRSDAVTCLGENIREMFFSTPI